jgi:hypothetical protein
LNRGAANDIDGFRKTAASDVAIRPGWETHVALLRVAWLSIPLMGGPGLKPGRPLPSANGCVEQVGEHRLAFFAAVVAPHVLVQVALQPLVRDAVMDAPDGVLEQAEEAVDVWVCVSPWT